MTNSIPFANNSADVQALVAALDSVAVGSVITYDELSGTIGRDIQTKRYLLEAAQDRLLKQRKVFGCVYGVGLKRLDDSEIVECSLHAFRKIRRMSRKAATRLTSVEWNHLTSEEQRRHNLHLSVLGAIIHTATPRNMQHLSAACSNSTPMGLPTAQTLKLLAF
jgi:hypothetical protein